MAETFGQLQDSLDFPTLSGFKKGMVRLERHLLDRTILPSAGMLENTETQRNHQTRRRNSIT
jgi:hypothetical protein